MRIALIDYGAGNLHSLAKAIQVSAHAVTVTSDVGIALRADAIVLPGVGAFGLAAKTLNRDMPGIRSALADGFPCVGVCLGMQLLFENSEEGEGEGVGFFAGAVRRLQTRRIPQIGWNEVLPDSNSGDLFAGMALAYYANSYVCEPDDPSVVIARTVYEGQSFPAAVRRLNTIGVQFHPEKSSQGGVDLLGRMIKAVTA